MLRGKHTGRALLVGSMPGAAGVLRFASSDAVAFTIVVPWRGGR